jgi:hypothetical protein
MSQKRLPVNVKKLTQELKKHGMTKRRAAKEMGFSSAYFYYITKEETISESASILLKKLYDIDYEKYKREEKVNEAPVEPEKKPENKEFFEINYDKLNEILYNSVFRAVRDALQA